VRGEVRVWRSTHLSTVACRDHVLLNKGIGGTTSGIFSVCAEALVPPVRLCCLGYGCVLLSLT
jgi:hypothetical protein